MAERILSPEKFTYSASTAAFSVAASGTDCFEIKGADERKIQVLRVRVYATQIIGGSAFLALIKRSTANTGGTAVATTKVPRNSSSIASGATVQHYTANPTLGTGVGNVASCKAYIPAPAEIISELVWEVDLREVYGTPVVLRSSVESLCLNLNGVTITGGSFVVSVDWIEELTKPVGA